MSSILLVADRKSPGLTSIGNDLVSHTRALEAIRDVLAVRERHTRDKLNSFVRVKELIDLGLLRVVGGNRIELALTSSSGGSGATALADLTDVDLTGLVDGDHLVYDANYGLWLPQAISSGGDGGGSGLFSGLLTVPTQADIGYTGNYGAGTTTFADTAVGVVLTCPASTVPKIASVPATPYAITALLINHGSNTTGIAWTDGTKGQGIYANGTTITVQSNNSPTSFNSTQFNSNVLTQGWLIWLRLRDDGTTVYFDYSHNGVTWVTAYSVAKASGFLGSSGYSQITHQPNGSGQTFTIASWAVT